MTINLLDEIRGLCSQLYTVQPHITEDSLRRLVESDNSHLLVLRDQSGALVAMATVGIYRAPGGVRAWIEDVVTDESCRGEGLGRRIVQAAVELARSRGAATVALTTNPLRTAANALYRSLGFAHCETNVYKMQL